MSSLNILVTGGGGFLGKAIVERLLDEGHQVSILGRSPQPELIALGVKQYQGSITNYDLLEKATSGKHAVFHVAAKAGVWGSWSSYYQTNVTGTQNVLKVCKHNHVPYLIHTSTPSVVSNKNHFKNADESLPYSSSWLCHYAHTKAIAEKEVLKANDANLLKTIALRPHLIWGEGDPHIIPRIIEKAKTGKLKQVGDGSNKVDITHVDNAADAHLLAFKALTQGHPGGKAYFISDGEPVNLWDWINQYLEQAKVSPLKKAISYKKAYIIGSICEWVFKLFRLKGEPPMTRFVALQLAKSHYFSIDAARRDLRYKPTPQSISSLSIS